MACCGQGNGAKRTNGAKATANKPNAAPGDMVQVEYSGDERTAMAGSPSGLRYVFGPGRCVKWVDGRDVDWLLQKQVDGAPLFRQYAASATAVLVKRPETVLPDPDLLTVPELMALRLEPGEWAVLLDRERAGKNRKTAIDYMEDRLADPT